jgi:hypothetical protein
MVAVLADNPKRTSPAGQGVPALRLVEGGRRRPPVGWAPARDARDAPSAPPARSAAPLRRPSPAVARRRCVVAAFVVAATAVAILFALQAALGGGGGGPLTTAAASRGALRPADARSWVAQPGDTLWGIALAVHPHGDVRPLVDQLSAELHGRPLVAGERIPIP